MVVSFPSGLVFFPELFFLVSLLVLLVVCFSFPTISKSIYFNDLLIGLVQLILVGTIGLFFNQIQVQGLCFNENFMIHEGIVWVKVLIAMVLVLFLFLAFHFFKLERVQLYEFVFLIALSGLGMFVLVMVHNFFVFYMALELQSFCFYILAALKRYSNLSVEAALKYFVLGAFSSSIFLFGASLMYGSLGSLNFSEIELLLTSFHSFLDFNPLVFLGILFILVGFFFKLGLVPFHFWIADVYEGAPLLITAFFSIVPKLGFFFVLLLVFFFTFSSLAGVYGDLFFFSGLASIGLGMLYAFYQFKLKRLLAYSAITHVGYMLFALSQGSPEGFQAFLLYILIYIMSSLNIFGLLLAFRQQNTFYQLRKLVDLSFLQRSHGVLGLILSLTLLSFAGLPPLAGFFSKFYLFVSLMPFHNWAGLGGVMALTVPGSIYYLRMIRFSLFNPLKWVTFLFSIEVYRAHAFIIMISFYFNLFFFLFQGPLILWLYQLAFSFCFYA